MKKLAFAVSLALSGCANHQQVLLEESSGRQGSFQEYRAGILPVQTWVPDGLHRQLRVFVEGDGHAFVTASRPSTDPTPSEPVILRLALNEGDAGYLSRPCQYVTASNCMPLEWTDRRFSKDALVSMSGALDQMKRMAGAESLELVGYSGGGAMALLLAATRGDVVSVQTIAGNVAPDFWSSSKGLSPLTGSLDPLMYRDRLAEIPQRHMVGESDKVVPRNVVSHYAQALPHQDCVEVVTYSGDHWRGLGEAWRRFGATDIACR